MNGANFSPKKLVGSELGLIRNL